MEEGIFPNPAVAGILREHYIEARLHTDDQQNPERSERQASMQVEMTGSVAQPYYVVVDPANEQKLGLRKGLASEATFVKFFQQFIDARRTN